MTEMFFARPQCKQCPIEVDAFYLHCISISTLGLHNSLVRGSFDNKGSTISDNIRCSFKNIVRGTSECSCDHTTISSNILHTNVDNECTASVIVDLCRERNNRRYNGFTSSDMNDIIQIICTHQLVLFLTFI